MALPRKSKSAPPDNPAPKDRLTVSFLFFKVEGIGSGVKLALIPIYVFAAMLIMKTAVELAR
ncbi:MAG: hypothetical protein JWR80_5837 [Bradyrhizobium sp.]|nr:hypothetical protein [Bradyrhizobium sp.]